MASCDSKLLTLNSAGAVILNASGLLGLISSAALLRAAFRSSQRKSSLGLLVMTLAFADLTINSWYFIPSWIINYGDWRIRPAVSWCWIYEPVQRLLQLWSAVLAAMIALGLLLILLRLPKPLQWLRFGPLLSLPLAAVLALDFLLYPLLWESVATPWQQVCGYVNYYSPDAVGRQIHIYVAETMAIFVFLLSVHLYGMCRLRRMSPRAVAKRAFSATSRYILAFLFAWSGSAFFELFAANWDVGNCLERGLQAIVLPDMQNTLMALGGFFNFLAYRTLSHTFLRQQVTTFEQGIIERDEAKLEEEAMALISASFWSVEGVPTWPLEDIEQEPPGATEASPGGTFRPQGLELGSA